MKGNGRLPMFDVYHAGARLGAISLSERSQALLADGEHITVLYHTPQLLRDQLGNRTGAFTLHKEGDQLITDNAERLVEYINLQNAIVAAQGN